MAPKVKYPQRMCVVCRDVTDQSDLLRLSCHDKKFNIYSGTGRSFYLCFGCIEDEKRTLKGLARQCKHGDMKYLSTQLKEIITDVRKS